MSIPDFLDVCYVLIVDDLKVRLLSDRQIIGMAQAMGADIEMFDINEELQAFDEQLKSPPPIADSETEERQILRRALGLSL